MKQIKTLKKVFEFMIAHAPQQSVNSMLRRKNLESTQWAIKTREMR